MELVPLHQAPPSCIVCEEIPLLMKQLAKKAYEFPFFWCVSGRTIPVAIVHANLTDDELIQRLSCGDMGALMALFDRHGSAVYSYIYVQIRWPVRRFSNRKKRHAFAMSVLVEVFAALVYNHEKLKIGIDFQQQLKQAALQNISAALDGSFNKGKV